MFPCSPEINALFPQNPWKGLNILHGKTNLFCGSYTEVRNSGKSPISAPTAPDTRSGYNQPNTYGGDFSHRQAFNVEQDDYTSALASQRDAKMNQETTTKQSIPYQTSGDDIDTFAYREHMKQVADKAKQQEVQGGEIESTTAVSMRDETGYQPRGSGRRRSEEMRRQSGEREETSGRRRRQSGNYEARREREDNRSQDDYSRQQDDYRQESEGNRDYRQDEREHGGRSHGHRERRRRQSGDIEGQRERDDYRGSREEGRRHRRHSQKRGSLEGTEFQDVSHTSD